MAQAQAAARACQSWRDHRFDGGRLVAAGKHPTKGAYVRRVSRCTRCGYEATETEWTTPVQCLPARFDNMQEDR